MFFGAKWLFRKTIAGMNLTQEIFPLESLIRGKYYDRLRYAFSLRDLL